MARTPLGMVAALCLSSVAHAGTVPQYDIIDLGLVSPNDFASQGFGISAGGVAYGRSLGSSNQAWSWTQSGGLVALGTIASRPFYVANGANDSGMVVGNGTTTSFGAGALPIVWNNGVATALSIGGSDVGRANDVNNAGVVVGSLGSGINERGAMWVNGVAQIITATTPGGAFMTTAFAVNDAGMVVGTGIDPNNLARNVAILYDSNTGTAVEIPNLAGDNGGIPFGLSEAGHVVGSSSFNQSGSNPFIWDPVNGITEVPLPFDTSQGSARGVNSSGWVVGTASNAFAIPFLYDGESTYALQDLIDPSSGWDLSTNTSSSAMGISDNGTIVGTGVFNGEIRAYAMVLVPAPGVLSLLPLGGVMATRRRRR